jgi:Protein of unknown function (DUF2380)
MRAGIHSISSIAALGAIVAIHGEPARAEIAPTQPPGLAILDLEYVDTYGEPTDQTAAHQRRALAFVSDLRRDLGAGGQYRIVPIVCGAEPCTSRTNPVELQKAARAAGVKLVLIGGVHKMSSLIQWAKIQIADEEAGRIAHLTGW